MCGRISRFSRGVPRPPLWSRPSTGRRQCRRGGSRRGPDRHGGPGVGEPPSLPEPSSLPTPPVTAPQGVQHSAGPTRLRRQVLYCVLKKKSFASYHFLLHEGRLICCPFPLLFRHDAWGRGGSLNSLYIALNLTWSPALQCRQGRPWENSTQPEDSFPASNDRETSPSVPSCAPSSIVSPTAKTPLASVHVHVALALRVVHVQTNARRPPQPAGKGAPPRPSALVVVREHARGVALGVLSHLAVRLPLAPVLRSVEVCTAAVGRYGGCWSGAEAATRRPCPCAGGVPSRGGLCVASCRRGVPSDPSGGAGVHGKSSGRPEVRMLDRPWPKPRPSAATPAAPNARSELLHHLHCSSRWLKSTIGP